MEVSDDTYAMASSMWEPVDAVEREGRDFVPV